MASADTRHTAVARGLDYMFDYLVKSQDSPKRVHILGEQCISMFFDVWSTEADETLCNKARQHARAVFTLLEQHIRATWPLPWTEAHLLEVFSLIRYAQPLGFDLTELLERADAACTSLDMRHLTLPAHRHADWQAGELTSADWFDVMQKAFTYEYAGAAYPERFLPRPRLGLREVLHGLRRHVFEAPCQPSAGSDYGEASYLATHACYWLWAYTPSVDLLEEAPWLVAFVQRSLEFWMGEAEKRGREVAGAGRDGLVYADLDAIAECCDVLRSVQVAAAASAAAGDGGSSTDSHRCLAALPALLERASAWLLDMQRADGSWPHLPFPQDDPMRTRLLRLPSRDAIDEYSAVYDSLHATWTATMALCDRRAAPPASLPSRHGERVRALMRETNFRRQDVPKRARHKSKPGARR